MSSNKYCNRFLVCPRCEKKIAWVAYSHPLWIIEYHCDNCAYKGNYNWITEKWDEFSPEDYVECENSTLEDLIKEFKKRGGTVTKTQGDN